MKVAVIGAGFAGLSAAYYLSKTGVKVTIFEKESRPGGLASGYKRGKWNWSLENHYHHFFASDNSIKDLATEINHEIIFKKPKTSTYINGKIAQLDSPISLLNFKELSFLDRVRTGAVTAYLKITPYWKNLESITSQNLLIKTMGMKTWEVLWSPLFEGKFAQHKGEIPASWFWARIKKRSPSLGYPTEGFLAFADNLVEEINKRKGKIYYQKQVKNIEKGKRKFNIISNDLNTEKPKSYKFDKVICTLPFPIFLKIAPELPLNYVKTLKNLGGIGAINLNLRLKSKFLKDGTYWLNVNEKGFPFLAIVEHTNFMPKAHYANEHLVYVGNYLHPRHEYFQLTEQELFKTYHPYLKKINKNYQKKLIGFDVFKAPFAQPIFPLNYSKALPPLSTPIEGLFIATIQQVYPWDRGTNYAVELGKKVALLIK